LCTCVQKMRISDICTTHPKSSNPFPFIICIPYIQSLNFRPYSDRVVGMQQFYYYVYLTCICAYTSSFPQDKRQDCNFHCRLLLWMGRKSKQKPRYSRMHFACGNSIKFQTHYGWLWPLLHLITPCNWHGIVSTGRNWRQQNTFIVISVIWICTILLLPLPQLPRPHFVHNSPTR